MGQLAIMKSIIRNTIRRLLLRCVHPVFQRQKFNFLIEEKIINREASVDGHKKSTFSMRRFVILNWYAVSQLSARLNNEILEINIPKKSN